MIGTMSTTHITRYGRVVGETGRKERRAPHRFRERSGAAHPRAERCARVLAQTVIVAFETGCHGQIELMDC